jgi:hypothetical protein
MTLDLAAIIQREAERERAEAARQRAEQLRVMAARHGVEVRPRDDGGYTVHRPAITRQVESVGELESWLRAARVLG